MKLGNLSVRGGVPYLGLYKSGGGHDYWLDKSPEAAARRGRSLSVRQNASCKGRTKRAMPSLPVLKCEQEQK